MSIIEYKTMAVALHGIRRQVGSQNPNQVYVIELVSVRFVGFTPQLSAELQRFHNLQMLTLNDCGIKSLQGLPRLPALIRLDLVVNQIPGEQLIYLGASRHLQTLMMGGNQVKSTEELRVLTGLPHLLQLDFIRNPVERQPGYRQTVFSMFPSLRVLDSLDRQGKDAFNTTNMALAVAQIPSGLFDTSVPHRVPPPAPVVPRNQPRKKKLQSSSQEVEESQISDIRTHQRTERFRRQLSHHNIENQSQLIFPVARLKRHLRQTYHNLRIPKQASVFIAAVLEYVAVELVDGAAKVAKLRHKSTISPVMIRQAIGQDQELGELLGNYTISLLP